MQIHARLYVTSLVGQNVSNVTISLDDEKLRIFSKSTLAEHFDPKPRNLLKFIYSEKATKFCEISTSYVLPVKSKVEISQNFVAFSEYMNLTKNTLKLRRSLWMVPYIIGYWRL